MADHTMTGTLARAIGTFAQIDGDHGTAIPALTLHRRSAPTAPLHCVYSLALGVVAQGSKQVLIGEDALTYSAGQSMVTTIDAPVISHVSRASHREPFLGLMLTLDAHAITQLASEIEAPSLSSRDHVSRSITVEMLDVSVLDALVRLIALLREPALAPHLAPLIQREIVIRLLSGKHGARLRGLVTPGSPNQRIATTVAWLKRHFVHALTVDELAARAHMSPSTFRQHFRAITGSSPLQYQKQLRLQEARLLMMNESLDAGSAAGRVGYESASQFSREYSRLFGAPPQRDIKRMREA
jgi:AraC-like DNA-binding protein